MMSRYLYGYEAIFMPYGESMPYMELLLTSMENEEKSMFCAAHVHAKLRQPRSGHALAYPSLRDGRH